MLKDTKSLGNNKAPACESRGFVHKKRGVHFDTPPGKGTPMPHTMRTNTKNTSKTIYRNKRT